MKLTTRNLFHLFVPSEFRSDVLFQVVNTLLQFRLLVLQGLLGYGGPGQVVSEQANGVVDAVGVGVGKTTFAVSQIRKLLQQQRKLMRHGK